MYVEAQGMSLSVFNPSLCRLSPFHPVLCHCFKATLHVRILPRPPSQIHVVIIHCTLYVVVNFLFQLIFIFSRLFLGMVMYANEFKPKEKRKLTEIKNQLQLIQVGPKQW